MAAGSRRIKLQKYELAPGDMFKVIYAKRVEADTQKGSDTSFAEYEAKWSVLWSALSAAQKTVLTEIKGVMEQLIIANVPDQSDATPE